VFSFFEFANMHVKALSVCALFILILLPFHFIPNQTNETYAYVNLDINPSVELEVNKALEVKDVKPLNEDAKKLLDTSNDYIGTDLAEVVNQIMDDSVRNDMNKNGKQVLLGVSYAEKQDKTKRVLTHIKEDSLKQKEDWKSVAYKVPLDVWQEAHDQEISINELLAMESKKENSSIMEKLTTMGSISLKDQAIINSFYYPSKEKDSKTNSIKQNKDKKNEKSEEKVKKEHKTKENSIKEPEQNKKSDQKNQQSNKSKKSNKQNQSDLNKPSNKSNQQNTPKKQKSNEQKSNKNQSKQNNQKSKEQDVKQNKSDQHKNQNNKKYQNKNQNKQYRNQHKEYYNEQQNKYKEKGQ